MKVGFIGLGRMGSAMAGRLSAAGIDLIVWNRTKAKTNGVRAETADSPAQLAERAEIVFLSLANSEAVRTILTGPDGLLAAPLRGKVIVDTTTNHFEAVPDFYALVGERNGEYVEAPVIGSVGPAGQGALTILVSGTPPAFERARPVLKILGEKIFFLGDQGRATKTKLINNMVLGSLMCTLAEAVALGESVGLDRSHVLEILAAGAGGSRVLDGRRDKLEQASFPGDFTIELMYKDLHYAQDLAWSLKRPLLTGSIAKELFALAMHAGFGNDDIAGVYQAVRGH
jgi:3-hydroxyisobutyrate dehydrogenase